MQTNAKFEVCGRFGFAPSVIEILEALDESHCSFAYYSLRHAADIFRTVSTPVLQDMSSLLAEIAGTQQMALRMGGDPPLSKRSTELYKSLLANFARYIECSYEVILGVSPQKTLSENDRKSLHIWLNKHVAGSKIYYPLIKAEVDYFRAINNDLKHSSNYLCPVTVIVNLQPVTGYFLSAARPDGSIGPSDRFHRGRTGHATANSFHRDLRRLFYCVYLIAHALQRSITVHYRTRFHCDPPKLTTGEYDDGGYRDAFERVSALPEIYYPQEQGKPVPVPHLENGNGRRFLSFVKFAAPQVFGPFRVSFNEILPRGGRISVPFP